MLISFDGILVRRERSDVASNVRSRFPTVVASHIQVVVGILLKCVLCLSFSIYSSLPTASRKLMLMKAFSLSPAKGCERLDLEIFCFSMRSSNDGSDSYLFSSSLVSIWTIFGDMVIVGHFLFQRHSTNCLWILTGLPSTLRSRSICFKVPR